MRGTNFYLRRDEIVEIPESERVHASAVTYLVVGYEEVTTRILLSCKLNVDVYYGSRTGLVMQMVHWRRSLAFASHATSMC
jgi:hypothetical protein